jgi:hypothetical protein
MAERIKIYLKCCCGAEISVETDEYKKNWVDEQLGKFSALHKECPDKLSRNLTETFTAFKPGMYATNNQAPVSSSGPDLGAPFWTDPAGKKISY